MKTRYLLSAMNLPTYINMPSILETNLDYIRGLVAYTVSNRGAPVGGGLVSPYAPLFMILENCDSDEIFDTHLSFITDVGPQNMLVKILCKPVEKMYFDSLVAPSNPKYGNIP